MIMESSALTETQTAEAGTAMLHLQTETRNQPPVAEFYADQTT
jgi:hypothetical protein